MKLGTILCDLDDTLADARWRLPLWGNWDEFYAESAKDKQIEPMCNMVRYLSSSFKVIILTAREERYRGVTQDWLDRNGIWVHSMIMRPNGTDHIGSPELKIGLAYSRLGKDWTKKVQLMIDDREDVLAAFRQEGVMTLHATYAYENPQEKFPSIPEKVT